MSSNRKLRKRKLMNYADMLNDKQSTPLFENQLEDENSESDESVPPEAEDDNEYTLIRKKNLEEHEKFLRQLDFSEFKAQFSSPRTQERKKRKNSFDHTPIPERRTSMRLRSRTADNENVDDNKNNETVIEEPFESPRRNDEESVSMVFLDNAVKDIFSEHDDKEITCDIDLSKCSFSDYKRILNKCQMWEEPQRVLQRRITTLSISPSVTKFIVISGDLSGNLSLWDIQNNKGTVFELHTMQVSCVSFSKQDSSKFYSTSHEGIVRCGDINAEKFNKVYSTLDTSFRAGRTYHTTWHYETENALHIAVGSGEVVTVDLRSNNVVHTIKCHQRSVRTVQQHPVNEYCLLTSSGLGEMGIWDIRNSSKNNKASNLSLLTFQSGNRSHMKGLTSAFFSHSGNRIVATCNDDYVRVLNSENLDKISEIVKIPHNNHTGRWLSVFKAQWLPGRDDLFHVGSLLTPKRIQIYAENGQILHYFHSEFMTTYTPVIAQHCRLPLYVGGNSTGKLHIYSPNEHLRFTE